MREETVKFLCTHYLSLRSLRDLTTGQPNDVHHIHLHPDFEPDIWNLPNIFPASRIIDVPKYSVNGVYPVAAVEHFIFFHNIQLRPLLGFFRYSYSDGHADVVDGYPMLMFTQSSYNMEIAPSYILEYKIPRML